MPPEIAKYLYDIRQSCMALESFIQGKGYDAYLADEMLLAAVERKLEIIGEALSQARQIDATIEQSITDFRLIIRFRNILVHGYAHVNHKTVWGVLQNDLPILKKEVEALLTTFGPP